MRERKAQIDADWIGVSLLRRRRRAYRAVGKAAGEANEPERLPGHMHRKRRGLDLLDNRGSQRTKRAQIALKMIRRRLFFRKKIFRCAVRARQFAARLLGRVLRMLQRADMRHVVPERGRHHPAEQHGKQENP